MADPRIELLLLNLDHAFEVSAWHGTTLKGALRGLTEEQACFRPAPDRKNIWELLLHAAYWKYQVRRWILDEPKGTFGRKPANWPEPTTLKDDIAFLKEEHRKLRAAIEGFDAERLPDRCAEGGPRWAQMLVGIAAHDIHHTGQIQLLKRLAPASKAP